MSPFLILAIAIVVVVGMILVLRMNAFLALITAALLVSLLSPGEIAAKVTRVAEAFGSVAGAIGIVIALASITGKCLMDSGAADRIVRSFLKVLGEKRAAWALLGSAFVLSIPVFFDTVFYLLAPLARSLWKRTRRDYVLYVAAIVAGAATTHTLVPPTPGPLVRRRTVRHRPGPDDRGRHPRRAAHRDHRHGRLRDYQPLHERPHASLQLPDRDGATAR